MVSAGQIEIIGRLNIDDIKRGQREVNVGFEVMRQKTQSTFGSMELLGNSAAGLGTSLAKVAGLALTGLTGLAGLTPTLAPQFAKLKVETFKLAQVFGKELQPAFETATQKFSEFVSFLEGGSPMAELTKDVSILTGATGIALIGSQLLGLNKGVTIPIALAVATQTQKGRLAGGITGFLERNDFEEQNKGLPIRSAEEVGGSLATLITNTISGALAGAGVGAIFGGVGALPGALAGSIAGAGTSIYQIVRDDYFYSTDTSGLD